VGVPVGPTVGVRVGVSEATVVAVRVAAGLGWAAVGRLQAGTISAKKSSWPIITDWKSGLIFMRGASLIRLDY
jgi:hypothetical protein